MVTDNEGSLVGENNKRNLRPLRYSCANWEITHLPLAVDNAGEFSLSQAGATDMHMCSKNDCGYMYWALIRVRFLLHQYKILGR